MDSEILHTPFDAIRDTDELNFALSSPPSSPCSLAGVDSSPPDSPSITALRLEADDDLPSDDDSPYDSTPKNSQSSSSTSNVEMSPAHPYSASTRSVKRPALYGKDSSRPKIKKLRIDPEIDREMLSDATCHTLNFSAPDSYSLLRHGSIHDHDAYADGSLGTAFNLNEDMDFMKGPLSAQLNILTPVTSEEKIWEDAIEQATFEGESIIDLTGKDLTYISSHIGELNSRVNLERSSSPTQTQTRIIRRNFSRSTSQAALGQNEESVSLILATNKITRIPQELLSVRSLSVLSLRGNQLTEIPPGICNLKNLRSLNISNNKLQYLPAEITRLKLDTFAVELNPFMKNPEATKAKDKTRYVGPVTRCFENDIPSLFELALRALMSPADPILFPEKSFFEARYDIPMPTEDSDSLSAVVREMLADCVPGCIGRTMSPHASPVSTQVRNRKRQERCVSNCMSERHLPTEGATQKHVFVAHAEERITWDKFVAGQRVGGDEGIPLLWRGCSAGCLDFLDEVALRDDTIDSRDADGDWTMNVDPGANVSHPVVSPSQPPATSEFGHFASDDIDLDD